MFPRFVLLKSYFAHPSIIQGDEEEKLRSAPTFSTFHDRNLRPVTIERLWSSVDARNILRCVIFTVDCRKKLLPKSFRGIEIFWTRVERCANEMRLMRFQVYDKILKCRLDQKFFVRKNKDSPPADNSKLVSFSTLFHLSCICCTCRYLKK